MTITLTKEQVRKLLNVLDKTEYELATSNNVWVTDRPDIDPNIKWKFTFTEILSLIREQISVLEKLGDIRNSDCPVYAYNISHVNK